MRFERLAARAPRAESAPAEISVAMAADRISRRDEDVFDTAYADLVIRLLGGVVPTADGTLELRPQVQGLEHFRLRGVPYHGHSLDITWDRPNGERAYSDAPEGYTLTVDGEQVFTQAELGPVPGITLR